MCVRNILVVVVAVTVLELGGQVAPGEEVTIAAKNLSAASKNVFPVYDQFGGS